jgi:serine/threonine protein kinase
MADRVGQQLDHYRLLRLLGTGGFGEVYLAEHIYRTTQPPVAIKILPQLALDDLRSFLTEARTFRLKHPNIVQILDFGVEGRTPFIVMEYATGGTLRKRHPKGTRVPLPTIISYVKHVASALQYAHDERLVHRDVKPENMLISAQNQIMLSDFGIATIAHGTSSQSVETMAGTIPYMAPEQIQAHPRAASDQYSLAVVVYEWLCGNRPFQGTLTEVAVKQATLPPPPLREKVPAISPDVEQVVMTALAKDPKQRFGSVQAFATALEQASQPVLQPVPPSPVPPPPAPIPRRMVSIVSGILLVLLIGTFFASRVLTHSPGPPTPTAAPLSETVLCQADWSQGLKGWTGTPDWKALNGMLMNDGTISGAQDPPTLRAPCDLNRTPNYQLEAKVQVQSRGFDAGFGFYVRYTPDRKSGYMVGNTNDYGRCNLMCTISITPATDFYAPIEKIKFVPGTTIQTYTIEVEDNHIKVFIDGGYIANVTDSRFSSGKSVGLWDKGIRLTISSFKITSLPGITSRNECINGGLSGVSLNGLRRPAGTIQIESGQAYSLNYHLQRKRSPFSQVPP